VGTVELSVIEWCRGGDRLGELLAFLFLCFFGILLPSGCPALVLSSVSDLWASPGNFERVRFAPRAIQLSLKESHSDSRRYCRLTFASHFVAGIGYRLERKCPPHPTLHNWGAMTAAFESLPFPNGTVVLDRLRRAASSQIAKHSIAA
jgi:hypothetical protein